MMIHMTVSKVYRAGLSVDEELALPDMILDPIKMHIHGFGSFLFDHVIGESCGSGIIGLHWCWWLRMANFIEGDAERNGFLLVEE
jgi:hypothetical protein